MKKNRHTSNVVYFSTFSEIVNLLRSNPVLSQNTSYFDPSKQAWAVVYENRSYPQPSR